MNRDAWKNVDYNSFAKTFSNSRKNMKWEEILYFLDIIHPLTPSFNTKGRGKELKNIGILDVWCWNGRFLWELLTSPLAPLLNIGNYLWIDLSKWLLDEAENNYPWFNFQELNMLDLSKLNSLLPLGGALGWGAIFFIASFHHLKTIKDRLKVLKDAYTLLESWWMIFMTNWALDSELNKEKYKDSIISPSLQGEGGRGWGFDYNIKIWKYNRFYHCFSLKELEYLSKEVWFEIIENRLFENNKNYILILKKR